MAYGGPLQRIAVETQTLIKRLVQANSRNGMDGASPKTKKPNTLSRNKKQNKDDDSLTTSAAFWHCMTLVLGLGTLTMPYALKGLGWAGLIILAFLAWLSSYTAKLLCVCIDYTGENSGLDKMLILNSYPDIGQVAFGTAGRQLVEVVLYVDLVASSALFLVFIATNLNGLFPWIPLDRFQWIILTTMSLLPTIHMKLSNLSYLSKIGSYVMIALVLGILYAVIAAAPEDLEGNEYDLAKFEMAAIGNIVFAFACHGTLLTIYRRMENPADVDKLFDQVYATGYLLKFLVGATGYFLFAQNVGDQVTLNLPQEWLKIIVTVAVTLKKWLTYALPLEPVAIAAEEKWKDKTITIRTGLVILTALLALCLPYFGLFQSLVGSVCAGFLVLIFPLVFYLKLYGHKLSKFLFWAHAALLVFCVLLMIVATYDSLAQAQELFENAEDDSMDLTH